MEPVRQVFFGQYNPIFPSKEPLSRTHNLLFSNSAVFFRHTLIDRNVSRRLLFLQLLTTSDLNRFFGERQGIDRVTKIVFLLCVKICLTFTFAPSLIKSLFSHEQNLLVFQNQMRFSWQARRRHRGYYCYLSAAASADARGIRHLKRTAGPLLKGGGLFYLKTPGYPVCRSRISGRKVERSAVFWQCPQKFQTFFGQVFGKQ